MKIVVTGAAGFIGSHLSEELLKLGHKVTGIDSFDDYYPKRFKQNNLALSKKNKNFRMIKADLLSTNLPKLLKGADIVFHLAARPGIRDSWKNIKACMANNLLSLPPLLAAIKTSKVKKLIFASSSSVYGKGSKKRSKETFAPDPVSPYALSKYISEQLLKKFHERTGISISILRLFTVYGPRQRPDMAIRRLIDAALKGKTFTLYGNGRQTRDFTYIDDIIKALVASIRSKSSFEIINIGSGKQISLSKVIKLVEKIAHKAIRLNKKPAYKGEMTDTLADISKAKKLLKYHPSTTLINGIKKEVAWMMNQGL